MSELAGAAGERAEVVLGLAAAVSEWAEAVSDLELDRAAAGRSGRPLARPPDARPPRAWAAGLQVLADWGRVRGAGTLYPRSHGTASPSSTDAPFRTVPNQTSPGTSRRSVARTEPRQPRSRRSGGGRRHSVTPTVIKVPRAQSIPRMGNSIPPLESHGRSRRVQTDLTNTHGFRGIDFGYRQAAGFPYRFPVVYLPFGYGYGNYASHREQIVIVDHNTATRSNADVERVPTQAEPQAPVEPELIEVRPSDSDESSTTDPRDPASVEVLRGNRAADATDDAPLYLLARRDETIVRSREHWMSGNTIHYVTPSGEHRQILIENLDLDLTARLNHERGLSFTLEVVPQN